MKARKISSPANNIIKEIIDIARRSRRADSRFFIAEGPHLVESALAAPATVSRIIYVLGYERSSEGKSLLTRVEDSNADLIEVPGNIFSKISDAESPQGILAVVSSPSLSLNDLRFAGKAMLAVCDGISDPGNLGTIIRIADAAGADAVIVLPGSCDPYSPKAVRATAGSIFNLPLIMTGQEDFYTWINDTGIQLVSMDVRAEKTLYNTDLTGSFAAVIGNESRGVSRFILDRAHSCIKIPMSGKSESLNAAVSAAICLFEAVRQRKQT